MFRIRLSPPHFYLIVNHDFSMILHVFSFMDLTCSFEILHVGQGLGLHLHQMAFYNHDLNWSFGCRLVMGISMIVFGWALGPILAPINELYSYEFWVLCNYYILDLRISRTRFISFDRYSLLMQYFFFYIPFLYQAMIEFFLFWFFSPRAFLNQLLLI